MPLPLRPARRVATASTVLLLAFGAAACSGDDDGGEKKSEKKDEPTQSSSLDENRLSPEDLPKVPELKKGAKGAYKDATFGECPTENGEVSVDATIKNSGKLAKDYVVVVSWINDTSDVLGRAVGSVEDLEPGESEDLTLTTKLDAGVKTSCTFNVTRGDLKGE